MKRIRRIAIVAVAFAIGGATFTMPTGAQDVAPIFQQVPAVLYETYQGVNNPAFNEYFETLVGQYAETGGTGWSIYRESAKTAYRITALPDGLASLLEIQPARNASFQAFGDDLRGLWDAAWGSRHAAIYSAAPGLSVVPEGFTVDDIRALPYHRTAIYYLKWDQAPACRQALRDRAALDREAGIENFVLTTWNGGLGTPAQVVMVRVSAESQAADIGANRDARRAARQSYREEFGRLSAIMSQAAWHVESHNQTRVARLSYAP